MSQGWGEHGAQVPAVRGASPSSRLTVTLSPQVGSRRVDAMGFLEPLLQLLWAGSLCAKPALHPVSGELGLGWAGPGVPGPPPLPA